MKKFLALAVMLAFVVAIPVSVLAKDDGDDNAAQYCKANGNLGFNSQGRCVKFLAACDAPGNTGAICVCKGYLDNNPGAFYDRYNNVQDCVSFLQNGYVGNN
jgi:hypothetical protein